MALNKVHGERFPAHYNHHLMNWRRNALGYSMRAIARLLGYHHAVMQDVFHGRATNKTVYPVALFLALDWAKVHDLTLSTPDDFESAVLVGASGAHLIAPQEAVSNSTPGAI